MKLSPRTRFSFLAILFLVVQLFCNGSTLAATAPPVIRMGYPQPSGAMLPIWVMSYAKLDQKYGVNLENIYISGGARLTQSLVAGDLDMASTGGAVINAVLSGADLVCIAIGVPTYGFSLYARPDVKDVTALRGKVVGVMTKGASSDHGLAALLRHNNLREGQDVKVLYLGGLDIKKSSISPASNCLMFTAGWSPAAAWRGNNRNGLKPISEDTSPASR